MYLYTQYKVFWNFLDLCSIYFEYMQIPKCFFSTPFGIRIGWKTRIP